MSRKPGQPHRGWKAAARKRHNEGGMTFKQAMAKAKQGHRVHDDASMAEGWTIAWFSEAKDFFNINPHTGSNYHFTPTQAQRDSTAWSIHS